ncbi:hypothetical protein [Streptomyces sp. NPDC048521]|uniref:hypothetical protein n=1 Tax=Streptomyces sp. NPDC048521 TaxID=3365566 RepID=UPI0037223F18
MRSRARSAAALAGPVLSPRTERAVFTQPRHPHPHITGTGRSKMSRDEFTGALARSGRRREKTAA